ncbi:MAG TPA: GNAT family N-acyltransferase, partial [Gemmatimonadales bacterium]|nr:GNAT family N-acyltransferase [Gemmatimonadales bacterium]
PPFPAAPESIPTAVIRAGSYSLRFAATPADLDLILRLRFEVFNLELNEGLDTAYATGRDEDEFDALFHHILVWHHPSGRCVGTYRMQTAAMARTGPGYYSAGEFELHRLPAEMLERSVEIGRACVAREHRTGRVLHLLWRGLAEYLSWNRCHALFGCCSLTTQDLALGGRAYRHLQRIGAEHREFSVGPLPGLECELPPATAEAETVHIPALFQSYLNLGARILGPPAIDRLFKTIDFLVLLDVHELEAHAYQSFFR